MVSKVGVKKCVTCGVEKELSKFGRVGEEEGARKDCKECANAASKRSREKGKGVVVRDARMVDLVKEELARSDKVRKVVVGWKALSDKEKGLFGLAVEMDL